MIEPIQDTFLRARSRPGRTYPGKQKVEHLPPTREHAALALACWLYENGTGLPSLRSNANYRRMKGALKFHRECVKSNRISAQRMQQQMAEAKRSYFGDMKKELITSPCK